MKKQKMKKQIVDYDVGQVPTESESFEFKGKTRFFKVPDKAGRGRGVPPMGGPPRPTFKPNIAPPGGPPGAGRGRGRGGTTRQPSTAKQRPVTESNPFSKPPASSPFGGEQAPTNPPKQEPLDESVYEDRPMQISAEKKKKIEVEEQAKEAAPVPEAPKQAAPPQQETSKKKPPLPPAAPLKAPKDEQASDGSFLSMLTGFIEVLKGKKQAYTGKPASDMYFDDKKGRWVINGMEESEEEEIAPPPMATAKKAPKPVEEKKEESATGSNALLSVGFGGALANRGRGRGRGASGAGRGAPGQRSQPGMPMAMPQDNKTDQKPPLLSPRTSPDNDKTALFQTAMDISQTEDTKADATIQETIQEEQPNEEVDLNLSSTLSPDKHRNQDDDREKVWNEKYEKQQEKIALYKGKIQKYLKELRRQRDENEQTIENFTQLCQDLKFRGMDEVEDLQQQLKLVQEQISNLCIEKAELQFNNEKSQFRILELQDENEYLQNKVSKLQQVQHQESPREQSKIVSSSDNKQTDIQRALDAQFENEQLSWQLSILRVDHSYLINEFAQVQRRQEENDAMVKRYQQELDQQKEIVRQLNDELNKKSQEQEKNDQNEKQQLHQLITKLQQEKERIQEVQRERQKENDLKLMAVKSEKQTQEQQIKKMQIDINNLKDQLEKQDFDFIKLQKDNQELLLKKEEKLREYDQLQKEKLEIENQFEHLMTAKSQQVEGGPNADFIRERLQEQIIYLQNEIRKRDEMLELSDYEDITSNEEDGEDELIEVHEDDDEEDELERKITQQLLNQTHHSDISNDEIDNRISFTEASIRDSALKVQQQIDRKISIDADHDSVKDQIIQVSKNQKEKRAQQKLKKQKRKTMQTVLKETIEEQRELLKKEIEEKIKVEKQLKNCREIVVKVKDGLRDVEQITDSMIRDAREAQGRTQSQEGNQELIPDQQSSQIWKNNNQEDKTNSESEEWDEEQNIQEVISKIFNIQRHYQAQVSDLQHQLQMEKLKLEDLESLTLDLEILNEEKELSDQEMEAIKQQLSNVQSQLREKQQSIYEIQAREESEKRQLKNEIKELEQKTVQWSTKHEQELQKVQNQHLDKLQDLKQQYDNDLIPEITKKAQQKENLLQEEISSLKTSLNTIQQELESQIAERDQIIQKISQNEEDLEQRLNDAEQANKVLAIEKEEMEMQVINSTKAQKDSQQQVSKLQKDLQSQSQNYDYQLDEIRKENNSMCQDLINQRDQHKQTCKELKTQVADLEVKNKELETSLKKQEDEMFWKLVQEVTALKDQLKDKEKEKEFLSKNTGEVEKLRAQYNEQIDELESDLDKTRQELASKQTQLDQVQNTVDSQSQQLEEKDGQIVEIQNLLDYQLEINDKRNDVIDDLQKQVKIVEETYEKRIYEINEKVKADELERHEAMNSWQEQKKGLKAEIDKLNEAMLEAQFKAEFNKAQNEKNENASEESRQNEILDLKRQITDLKLAEAALSSDLESKISDIEIKSHQIKDLEQELGDKVGKISQVEQKIKEFEEREALFKKSAEDMAKQFKERLKKEKDQVKKLQEELKELKEKASTDQILDYINTSKDLSAIFSNKEISVTNLQKLELNLSQFENLNQEKEKVIGQIVECLKNAGIEGMNDVSSFEVILEKLQILLQNYEEDQRQIKQLIQDNGNFHKENEDLKNQNYDLRYELQEANIRLEEAPNFKLQEQVKLMQEEKQALQQDFIQKIEKYEIALKDKSLIVEKAGVSQKAKDDKYADLSINRDDVNETRIKPAPSQIPQKKTVPPATKEAQTGSIFNSLASFFLTESEMEPKKGKTDKGGQDTEYEYYEYDDEEDEGDDGGAAFMKEELE